MKKRTKTKKPATKKVVAKPVENAFLKRLPRNRGEWLTICINLTERAMGSSTNDPMDGQWTRLHNELEAWKRDNPNETIRAYVGTKLASEVA